MVKPTGSTATITIYLDRADIERADALARAAELSRSALIRRLLAGAASAKPASISTRKAVA